MILIFSVLIILINIRSTTPSQSGSSNPKLWQGFESGTDFSEKQKELDIKIKEAEMEREKAEKELKDIIQKYCK